MTMHGLYYYSHGLKRKFGCFKSNISTMKNSDPEAITIGCVSQNLTPPRVLLLLYEIVLTLFYCTTSGALQSTVGFVKSRNSIKKIPMVHEGWPVVWTPFCFASLRMLNNNIDT